MSSSKTVSYSDYEDKLHEYESIEIEPLFKQSYCFEDELHLLQSQYNSVCQANKPLLSERICKIQQKVKVARDILRLLANDDVIKSADHLTQKTLIKDYFHVILVDENVPQIVYELSLSKEQ